MSDPEPPQPESAYSQLRLRERRFVDAYVECGIGTKAIIKAGFTGKRPDATAWHLLHRADIKAAIAEREEQAVSEAGVRAVRVLQELAAIAYFDHRKLFDETGKPIPVHLLPAEVSAGLAGIEIEDLFATVAEERMHVGNLHKYKAWSKVDAAKLLLQYMGKLTERRELTGKDGGPIRTQQTAALADTTDPNEAARIYQEMMGDGR